MRFRLLAVLGLALLGIVLQSLGLCAAEVAAPDAIDFNFPPISQDGKRDYFTIAENGKATCCIVVPRNHRPDEVAAATTLQTYLGLITGATVTRHTEAAPPAGLNQIHVGETDAARAVPLDLPPARYGRSELPNVNGYLVKTVSPQLVVVRGATPKATLLGAVGLLRRYGGVRRYWPGEPGGIGDVVPKAASLRLPEIEWRDWPYFISRTMSGCDDRGPQGGALTKTTRLYDFWRMNATIPSNESYYRLMKAREHADEPELFPLINGRRFVPAYGPDKKDPHGWQPCVSNPRVAEIMAASIGDHFRQNPGEFALNLAVNDGYGDCTCERCRAMDAPGADPINRIGLCDRYSKFDNRVAELVKPEFPGKILAFIAYGSMALPPTTATLDPMLMPVLCVGGNAFQLWDDWKQVGAKHMGIYLYHNDAWFIMPKMDVHQSAKRIRYVVGSGLARHFYQEFYGIYPLDGMVGYVEQELLWDPRLDEDEILANFYATFFREAAGPMKSFYDVLEAGYTRWLGKAGLPHPHGPDLTSIQDSKSLRQFAVLPAEAALEAQKHLERATAAAGADAQVAERVALVKTIFDFVVPGARMYWAGDRLRTTTDAEAALADAREAVDSGLALADYKFNVMERPEVQAYARHDANDTLYVDLCRGSVHAEILNQIAGAFARIGKPEAWWHEQAKSEPRAILRPLMAAAAFDAGGKMLANVVADPGFEARGSKPAGATETDAHGHLRLAGVNVWASAGTPMSGRLASEEAHDGASSFVFQDTQRAGVSESVAAKDGDCLRMSVWVKHNDKKGTYVVQADPRGDAGMLPRTTVPVPWKPGEWQKLELTHVVSPGTKTVNLWVFVNGQSPGARIWVDDFFIGKYPE